MTENQNDQVVQNNQNGKQGDVNPNTPKKENNPYEKTAIKEDEKVKPMPAEEEKEHEPREHPHEVSVPVASKETTKGSI